MTIYKSCRQCHQYKDIDLFYGNPRVKDLHGSYCKKCSQENSAKYNKTPKGRKNLYRIQREYRIRSGIQKDDRCYAPVSEKIEILENEIKDIKKILCVVIM